MEFFSKTGKETIFRGAGNVEEEEINRDWLQLNLGSLQPTVNNLKKLGHRQTANTNKDTNTNMNTFRNTSFRPTQRL